MLDNVPGERDGKFLKRDRRSLVVGQFEKGLPQGELVGSDVAAEEDDGAPEGFEGGVFLIKQGHSYIVEKVLPRTQSEVF